MTEEERIKFLQDRFNDPTKEASFYDAAAFAAAWTKKNMEALVEIGNLSKEKEA